MKLSFLLCSVMALPLCSSAFAGLQNTEFKRTITKTVGLKYVVYLPDEYKPGEPKQWPLILFLHGAGERGDDLKVISGLKPLTYAQNTKGFPFILVAPQCPAGEHWFPDTLNALLDEVQKKYHTDPDRVYLTGYSMGGTGTWMTAMEHPDRFAAIAPVCGRALPPMVGKLAKMPTWVFHGDADDVVHIRNSQQMLDALNSAGASDVQFTVYPGETHNVWDKTYENPKLYEWFLAHKRARK